MRLLAVPRDNRVGAGGVGDFGAGGAGEEDHPDVVGSEVLGAALLVEGVPGCGDGALGGGIEGDAGAKDLAGEVAGGMGACCG